LSEARRVRSVGASGIDQAGAMEMLDPILLVALIVLLVWASPGDPL
jgi:hypothetical protein